MILSPTVAKEEQEKCNRRNIKKNNFSETLKKFLGFVNYKK